MKRDSLSWQILRRVLLIHALAALLLTATQLWYDYQGNIKVIENQLSNAYKMFGSSVADAFYYADKNMIKQIFKGALSHSDYTGMLLYDSIADEYLSQGNIPDTLDPLKKEMVEKPGVFYLPNSGGLFGYQHQLTIIDDLGQQQILGHMVVFSEKRLAINQLKATVLIIILNSMLKAAVLVFMFLMMFNRILLRPLRRIVSTVEEIDPDNLDQVELNLGLPQNNELTLLENHLNQLFKSLHNSQKEIQTFNKKLETKVKARTLELNQAKHELDIVVETVPAMLWYLDADQQVRYTNKMAARMSELTPEQAIGKNVMDLFPEEFAKDYQRDNEAVLLSGEAKHRSLQTILEPESGKDICIQTEKIPVLSENGEAEGLLVFSIDITEQKQAEVALRKSEAELQALFDGMTDLVFLFNKEGRYLKIAAVTEDLLYKPASELLGKTIEEVLPKKQAEYFIDSINLSIDKQQAVSLVYSFKIGTKEVWFDARISPLPDKRVIFVARDITEMKRAELEIQLAKEFAEQANIEKSHFLAAASHDLRQPLNSMGLFLYALRQKSKNCDDNKIITLLDQIDGCFLALKNLFDSLLEISHLDAGTINTVSKNFKTSIILQPLIDDMSELAAEKNLDMSYQAKECYLNTDPVLLSRIMRNLIDNAIKYTHKGKIDIIEIDDGNFITIKVMDTGIGIPEHEFKNIFNAYHQLANKARDRRKGIGLGLSLVKKMCTIIGAEISVESTVDKGSVFALRLPTVDKVETEVIKPVLNNSSLKGTQVLVIDDEPEALEAMSWLLDDWKCLIEVAENDQQAMASISKKVPDIILCDYRLQEDITGIEVVKNLRKALNQDVPAIIITGDTDTSVLKKIQKEGFLMLSKPVTPKELESKMELLTNG